MNNPKKKIKVLIADDHHLFKEGLTKLLEVEEHLDIIGQVSNGKEVLTFLEYHSPHVVLLDDHMPVMNGSEALLQINSKYPGLKVIMLTMNKGKFYELEYKSRGAHFYLTKETASDVLVDTINKVCTDIYFYNGVFKNVHIAAIKGKHPQLSLNEIQIEIIILICNSFTTKDIAFKLGLSEDGVSYHRKQISYKTKTDTIPELVKYAIRNGIVSAD